MKNTNKIIIILILLIIVLSVMIFIVIHLSKTEKEQQIIEYGEKFEIPEEEQKKKDGDVHDLNELKMIENCIQNFYDTLNTNSARYYSRNQNGDYVQSITDEEINKNIIYYLSDNFINSNEITTKNLNNFIKKIKEKEIITILKAKAIYEKTNSKYVINGFSMNSNYELKNEFYMYVNLDLDNHTFSLEPINKNNMKFDEIQLESDNNRINVNENNIYKNVFLNKEEKIQEYINRYKRISLSNPRGMYDYYLDEEYKNKKFENYEEFKTYIQKRKDTIKSIRIEKYDIKRFDEYIIYTLVDQNDKYYILIEYKDSSFRFILDTYTIDLPEFIDKYNTALKIEKAEYNIQRVFDAINDKDYKYVYNKLNETFRKNNYKTVNELETHLKNNLFEYNNIEDATYEENGDNYVFNLKITDKSKEKSKDIQIIIKLNNETDFEMSFNFN